MKRAVTEYEILKLIKNGQKEVHLTNDDVLTPLAIDRIKHSGLVVVRGDKKEIYDSNYKIKIVIGSDHTGVKVKKALVEFLKSKSYEVLDVGTYSEESVDYPDIAFDVANRISAKESHFGILIDATGIPSAITANKIPGIRAATCYNEFSAKSSREHNNANILVLGARTLGEETIKSIAEIWLGTSFLGDRHQKRLDKIKAIEDKLYKK